MTVGSINKRLQGGAQQIHAVTKRLTSSQTNLSPEAFWKLKFKQRWVKKLTRPQTQRLLVQRSVFLGVEE